jgi:hypothetical protein
MARILLLKLSILVHAILLRMAGCSVVTRIYVMLLENVCIIMISMIRLFACGSCCSSHGKQCTFSKMFGEKQQAMFNGHDNQELSFGIDHWL